MIIGCSIVYYARDGIGGTIGMLHNENGVVNNAVGGTPIPIAGDTRKLME